MLRKGWRRRVKPSSVLAKCTCCGSSSSMRVLFIHRLALTTVSPIPTAQRHAPMVSQIACTPFLILTHCLRENGARNHQPDSSKDVAAHFGDCHGYLPPADHRSHGQKPGHSRSREEGQGRRDSHERQIVRKPTLDEDHDRRGGDRPEIRQRTGK